MILSSSQCQFIILSKGSETSDHNISPSPCQVLPSLTKLAAPSSPPHPSTSGNKPPFTGPYSLTYSLPPPPQSSVIFQYGAHCKIKFQTL